MPDASLIVLGMHDKRRGSTVFVNVLHLVLCGDVRDPDRSRGPSSSTSGRYRFHETT
jgi:hypothetical protein